MGLQHFPEQDGINIKCTQTNKNKLSLHDQNEEKKPLMESQYISERIDMNKKCCMFNLRYLYTKHTTFWLLTTVRLLGNNPIFNTLHSSLAILGTQKLSDDHLRWSEIF